MAEQIVAYKSLGVRWDGIEHFLLRHADGSVTERYGHISYHLPYRGFSMLGDYQQPPTYDRTLTIDQVGKVPVRLVEDTNAR